MYDDAAIVYHILMDNRPNSCKNSHSWTDRFYLHANIANNADSLFRRKEFREHFPRMEDRIP